jgi:hypothetical protein
MKNTGDTDSARPAQAQGAFSNSKSPSVVLRGSTRSSTLPFFSSKLTNHGFHLENGQKSGFHLDKTWTVTVKTPRILEKNERTYHHHTQHHQPWKSSYGGIII